MLHIDKLYNKIYLISFDSHFETMMHFFRFHADHKIPVYKTPPTFIELMEWYTKNRSKNQTFSYTKDYIGLALSREHIMPKEEIRDKNSYDNMMLSIIEFLDKSENYDQSYTIIGMSIEMASNETFWHEIAHALFWVEDNYFKKTNQLIKKIPSATKKRFIEFLAPRYPDISEEDMNDEIQAYLASEDKDLAEIHGAEKQMNLFKAIIKPYKKLIKIPLYFKDKVHE